MDTTPRGEITPSQFFLDMNNIALYALSNGAPFFAYRHFTFIAKYMNSWPERGDGSVIHSMISFASGQQNLTGALMAMLLPVRKLPAAIKLLIMSIPLTITVVWGNYTAIIDSFPSLMARGVRSIPPLITVLVVVFLTGDAWRILGTGFTWRFFLLVAAFLLASLFSLIRKDYWADLDVPDNETDALLGNVACSPSIGRLIKIGATPLPMVKPAGRGSKVTVCGTYLMYTLLSLIAVAVSVSLSLIAVGVILISANQTKELADSVNVIWTIHGNFVITRQLLSLSFSLGAFAAFFLVAGQRPEERPAFMRHMLSKLRGVLLIYSVYCHAYDNAAVWTGMAGPTSMPGKLPGDTEAGGLDAQTSPSHHGRPTSWAAVAIIITGFIVGGIAMVAGPAWWLFWTGAGIIVAGGIFAWSWHIVDDWY
jgi:hypothetical protein